MKNSSTGVTEEELSAINAFSRKKLTQEEVYVFPVTLCDNEIDRDFERFLPTALEKLASLFAGKTGIFDHNAKSTSQTARIFKTWVETDKSKRNSLGEPYCALKAKAYMVRTGENEALISEIEGGIKKEVSVSCAVSKAKCSICGADLRKRECDHSRGKRYSGRLCYAELSEPTDAYEWSFVAVPAQRNAGVMKSFAAGGRRASQEELARFAEDYRAELRSEIIKNAAKVLPTMKSETLEDICSALDLRRLREMREAFAAKAAQELPLIRQLAPTEQTETSQNSEYKI